MNKTLKLIFACLLAVHSSYLFSQDDITVFSNDLWLMIQVVDEGDSILLTPELTNSADGSVLVDATPQLKILGLGNKYFYIFGEVLFDIHYSASHEGQVVLMELKPKESYIYPSKKNKQI